MNNDQPNFYHFIKISSIGILIFYGIDIAISSLWVYHQQRPFVDKLAVMIRIAADVLFCIGALFLLRHNDRGRRLVGWGAILLILSMIVSKMNVVMVNSSQGILPNLPFFFLTLIQSLAWPIAVLWIVNRED